MPTPTDPARALVIARELFVIAATTREQTAESRARAAVTDSDNDRSRAALARATKRVEAKRAKAIEHFNRATGCS